MCHSPTTSGEGRSPALDTDLASVGRGFFRAPTFWLWRRCIVDRPRAFYGSCRGSSPLVPFGSNVGLTIPVPIHRVPGPGRICFVRPAVECDLEALKKVIEKCEKTVLDLDSL